MNGQRYYTYARTTSGSSRSTPPAWIRNSSQWIDDVAEGRAGGLEDLLLPSSACTRNASRHGSSVDMRVVLEPIFIKHGVNVVFSGHDHVYERLKPQKGIYYFVSGAAGQLRRGNMSTNGPDRRIFRSGPEFHARGDCRTRSCSSRRSHAPAHRSTPGVIRLQPKLTGRKQEEGRAAITRRWRGRSRGPDAH